MVMVSIAGPVLDDRALRIALDRVWEAVSAHRSDAEVYVTTSPERGFEFAGRLSPSPVIEVKRDPRAWTSLNRSWRKTHK